MGVPGVIKKNDDACKGCALGKFSKEYFPRSGTRFEGVLDLVHSDVHGSMMKKYL